MTQLDVLLQLILLVVKLSLHLLFVLLVLLLKVFLLFLYLLHNLVVVVWVVVRKHLIIIHSTASLVIISWYCLVIVGLFNLRTAPVSDLRATTYGLDNLGRLAERWWIGHFTKESLFELRV